jgi:hypothetical protein
MKLYETYQNIISDGYWRRLDEYLIGQESINEVDAVNLNQLLNESKFLIFEAFGINPSDGGKYFIAGSARLFKSPNLLKVLNELDKSFPLVIGDLDVIIPNKEQWDTLVNNFTNEDSEFLKKLSKKIGEKNIPIVMEKFKKQQESGYVVYRPGKGGLGLTDSDIEVFDEWRPDKVKGGENVRVRTTSEIMSDAVQIGGFYYMNVRDVIDYKWQLNRDKEKEILNLIGKYVKDVDNLKPKEGESPEELEKRKSRGSESLFKNIHRILKK